MDLLSDHELLWSFLLCLACSRAVLAYEHEADLAILLAALLGHRVSVACVQRRLQGGHSLHEVFPLVFLDSLFYHSKSRLAWRGFPLFARHIPVVHLLLQKLKLHQI